MTSRAWVGVVRYGVPGLALGLALALGFGGGRGLLAQGPATTTSGAERSRQPAAGDGSGTIAFTTNVPGAAGTAQMLYLIDTKARAFAIYRVDPSNAGKGTVRLEAARQYQWDLKLSDYNNQGLAPTEIETAVRAGGTTKR